jgi:hypothetical protein
MAVFHSSVITSLHLVYVCDNNTARFSVNSELITADVVLR